MANVIPFKGVLYDPAVVGKVADVVAPPYDVIDGAFQRALHARHPHNVIRLELGLDEPGDQPTNNRYTRAAAALREWLTQGVLRRDREAAVYPYQIEYQPPAGEPGTGTRVMRGFLTTVELAEFGTGHIYPHENTRSAAKEDRLRLMEACRANFSPIFSLFSDPDGNALQLIDKAIDHHHPRFDFHDDDGFRHRLWAITDCRVLDSLVAALRDKPLFIADGHHRYETALTYRKLRRQQAGAPVPHDLQPYDSVMMLLGSLEDPGLTVLPTHRICGVPLPRLNEITERLHNAFLIEGFPFQAKTEAETRQRFLQTLRAKGATAHAFGLALRGIDTYLLLQLRPDHPAAASPSARDRLDVSILHNQVLGVLCTKADEETLTYTKNDHEALDLVRGDKAGAALILNPTKVGEVRAVATAGERMPHKSTYFFPKPLTGLALNVMED